MFLNSTKQPALYKGTCFLATVPGHSFSVISNPTNKHWTEAAASFIALLTVYVNLLATLVLRVVSLRSQCRNPEKAVCDSIWQQTANLLGEE